VYTLLSLVNIKTIHYCTNVSNMITWQKLTSHNLKKLHSHYKNFEPYSDLNVVNLWGYMSDSARWFQFGDTVVYELWRYTSNEKYYSILGKNDSARALKQLLSSEQTNESLVLDNIPHTTIKHLVKNIPDLEYTEDHDNHDYIFKVESMANFSSRKLRKRHASYRKLIRSHPGIQVRLLDQNTATDKRAMFVLFKQWVKARKSEDWQAEHKALKKALNIKDFPIICIGAFHNDKLIGFTVNEPVKNGYYQGHFGKVNYSYPSLGLLLEHETAKFMNAHFHSKFINLQQDLGIEGIRYYKNSLGPCKKLKKYKIVVTLQQLEGIDI
jgi:hypothetical protein